MEIEEAKALTEALTGKALTTYKRERLAVATYGSLTASYLVAKEKEAVPTASLTIKHLIALTASHLVSLKPDKEVEAHALEIVKAAGYIVEALDMKLGVPASEAFRMYLR